MKEAINKFLIMFGIFMLTLIFWRFLELLLIGKVMPDKVDTIIWVLLNISLYQNLQTWNKE